MVFLSDVTAKHGVAQSLIGQGTCRTQCACTWSLNDIRYTLTITFESGLHSKVTNRSEMASSTGSLVNDSIEASQLMFNTSEADAASHTMICPSIDPEMIYLGSRKRKECLVQMYKKRTLQGCPMKIHFSKCLLLNQHGCRKIICMFHRSGIYKN